MNKLLTIFCLLLVAFSPAIAIGQETPNLGIPRIMNFTKQEYKAGTQNWDFAQDENGVIYVANNEGMLSYDGATWQLYPLPNKTIVRSVDVNNQDGRIYVGGQDEIGYFHKNQSGFLVYESIKQKVPKEYQDLSDIWTLFHKGEEVYFISNYTLFCYSNDTVKVHPDKGQFLFLGKGKERIIAQNFDGTVYTLENDLRLEPIGKIEYELASVFELEDEKLLLATIKNGIYLHSPQEGIRLWENDVNDYIFNHPITKIQTIQNERIAIGTALGGMLVLNKNGAPLYKLDKSAGLENNTIRSLFEDRDHNLWLGLDNGISLVSISTPITYFYPDGSLEGTSYAIKIHKGDIYIGTANGLYKNNWAPYYNPLESEPIFKKVPGSEGQVWGLNIINEQLFMGHHEGAFLVDNTGLKRISPSPGYWIFEPDPLNDSIIVAGAYNGLYLLKKRPNTGWINEAYLNNFNESSRFVISTSNGDFWVSHPYRGVYKIQINRASNVLNAESYGTDKGLPSITGNHVFKIWGEVLVCAKQGIFKYSADTDRFEPYDELNNILSTDTKVRRLFEDAQDNLWYITQNKIGFLKIEDRGLRKEVKNYELPGIHNQLMGGFELIYAFDSLNVFLGSEKGMIHINPRKIFDHDFKFNTLIHEVHLIKHTDSLLYSNQINTNRSDSIQQRFPSRENSFRFLFTSTNFSPFQNIFYQYQLDGFDEDWSYWSENTSREYTNLPPGQYTFKVRSGIPDVYTSNTAYFTFYINHPWYATPFAYGVYSFIFLLGIVSLIWIPRRKFEKEKALIEQEKEQKVAYHKAEVQQSREELTAVKNEKLNAEIKHKNKELASTTMHLLQKNELIEKLRTELKRLQGLDAGPKAKKELRRIMGMLNDDSQLDEEWEDFFFHFDQVHSDFFKRLKEQYPQLTAKDQRICAYLRMNLSTKEIAPLMNISVRGVEISRYRLRKKLNLDSDVNLNEFMMSF